MNGSQLRFPQELLFECLNQCAVLVIERALAFEVIVVRRDFLESLRRDVLASDHVLQERHDVRALFRPPKGHQENTVVFQFRVAHGRTLAPKTRSCKLRVLPSDSGCALACA